MAGEDISSKNTACDWPAGRGLAPAVGAVPQPGAEQGEPSEWDRARGQGALGGARSASLPPRQINPPREGKGGRRRWQGQAAGFSSCHCFVAELPDSHILQLW